MFEIFNTLTEDDVKNDFVGMGTYVNANREAAHSVLVIKYQGSILHFHYTGEEILFDEIYDENCFHKITNTIIPELIPSLIVMCRRILKNANPRYGYFYSGQYYDENGNHFSDSSINQIMTCSGFCLNVLKGFLEVDYLNYTEWVTPSYPTVDYLEWYANKYGYSVEEISDSHRRISPLELLCSAYFTKLPISKTEIDSKVDEVSEYLINY